MWEERNMVLWLMDYHSNADIDHKAKYKAIHDGVERIAFMTWVLEQKKNCPVPTGNIDTDEQRNAWKKLRYLLDECIEDGYLRQEDKTRKEIDIDDYSPTTTKYKKVPDGSYLHLTSKGKKLSRKTYFYLKYLPEEFGDMKIVLITVFGTIITSPLWLELKPLIAILIAKIIG